MFVIRNKTYTILLLIITIMLVPKFVYSQNQDTTNQNIQTKIDSLQDILTNHLADKGEDTTTIHLLTKLYDYSLLAKPYLALEFAAQALTVLEKSKDSVELAMWHQRIADVYFNQKVYYLAMESYMKAYQLFFGIDKKQEAAYSLLRIGQTYFIQYIDDVSLDYYKKAYELFKSVNNNQGISITLDNIGKIYLRQFKYDAAREKFMESLNIRKQLKDLNLIGISYTNLAEVNEQLEEYEVALQYLTEALRRYKIVDNHLAVAETYSSFGEIYLKDDEFDLSNENYEKALQIYKELEIDQEIAHTYNKLGYIHYNQGNYAKAAEYARKTLAISEENNFLEQKKEACLLFSNIYSSQGNKNLAFDFLTRYAAIKDSILDEKKQEQFSELQVSLETQKKEKEIEILKREDVIKDAELKRRTTENYALFVGVALVLIFAIYYFRNSNKMKKTNDLLIMQNEEINLQKEEIKSQAENLEKANTSIIIQKNEIEAKNIKITTGIKYASKIQTSMLPKDEKLQADFKDAFIYFRPKEAVSGDFYWYTKVAIPKNPLNGGKSDKNTEYTTKYVVAAVDCTGHGVSGAFMSMLGDAHLNQIVNVQKIVDTDKILYELHKSIRHTLQQEETENNDGMDIALCVIDKQLNTMEFCGAKNPLIYIQNGKLNRINGNLMSIGGLQKEKERFFTKHTVDISVPTQFYIFSDGYQDQCGGKHGRKFMANKLRDLFFELHAMPFSEQKELLNIIMDKWIAENPDYNQMDDQTIIGVSI